MSFPNRTIRHTHELDISQTSLTSCPYPFVVLQADTSPSTLANTQFKAQEPGTDDEVLQFCQLNYGVTFPIAKKVGLSAKPSEASKRKSSKGLSASYASVPPLPTVTGR